MLTDSFDHRQCTAVPYRESLTGAASNKEVAASGSVKHGIAS
jgi:hypothetical protein